MERGRQREHLHDLPPTQRTNRRKVLARRDKRRPEHRSDMFTCRVPRVGAAAPRSLVTGRRRCGGRACEGAGNVWSNTCGSGGKITSNIHFFLFLLFFFVLSDIVVLVTLKLTSHLCLLFL